MKIKLSPVYLLSTIAVAAMPTVAFGMTPETFAAVIGVLFVSALLVEPGASRKRSAFGQLGEVGGEHIEKEYKEVQANLKQVGDQLKQYSETTQQEMKKQAEMSQETRNKVDELLTKSGELQARLQEAEQKLVNAGKPCGDEHEAPKSAGQIVAEKLEEMGVSSSLRGSHRIAMDRHALSTPRADITTFDGSGNNLVGPDHRPGIVRGPERMMTVRDLVAPGTTGSNNVEYVRETGFTNNAATVSEGSLKPYSDIAYELANAPVRTIAHLFKSSRQILDDLSGLQSEVDARARYGLMLKEETQLLLGNGTGNNISGMVTQAEDFGFQSGLSVTSEQRIDRIRMAMLQVTLADYPATGIVLHSTDWALIEMTKDDDKRYLIGQPQAGTQPQLWGLPVVATNSMTQGTFLVGAFALACQIFDKMGIEVLISTENDKDFERNMVSIRAEERLAFTVSRPEALVTGDLNE